MERYESIFVAQPRMSEEEFDSLRQTYEQLIQTNGGSLTQSENWGKRRLAYRVRKHEEGHYGFLLFDGSGGLVKELERRYRLNEEVIKFLSVKAPPEGVKIAGLADFRPRRTEDDQPPDAAAADSRPATPVMAAKEPGAEVTPTPTPIPAPDITAPEPSKQEPEAITQEPEAIDPGTKKPEIEGE